MSIKEGIERRVQSGEEIRDARRHPSVERPFADEERRYLESSYNEKVLEAGRSIHKEAGTPKLFEELVELIRPDFSDVRIREVLMANGTVVSSVEWNFKDTSSRVRPGGYEYNSVDIVAYPLTQELAVMGGWETEVISKSQWSSDRKLLEDAAVRAYQNPIKMMGPPVRL